MIGKRVEFGNFIQTNIIFRGVRRINIGEIAIENTMYDEVTVTTNRRSEVSVKIFSETVVAVGLSAIAGLFQGA